MAAQAPPTSHPIAAQQPPPQPPQQPPSRAQQAYPQPQQQPAPAQAQAQTQTQTQQPPSAPATAGRVPAMLYLHRSPQDKKDALISPSANPLDAASTALYLADGTAQVVGKRVVLHRHNPAPLGTEGGGQTGDKGGFIANLMKRAKTQNLGPVLATVTSGSILSTSAKIAFPAGDRMMKMRRGGALFGLLNKKWVFEANGHRYYWNSKSRNLKRDASGRVDPILAHFAQGWSGALTLKESDITKDGLDLDTIIATAIGAMLLEDVWGKTV